MAADTAIIRRLQQVGGQGEIRLEITSHAIRSLTNDVAKYAAEAKTEAEAVFERYGQLMYEEAFRLCPEDTGNLRASITLLVEELGYLIFTDVTYAAYVEYGTSRAAAQPFMLPAFQRYKDDLYRDLHAVLVKARGA